MDAFNFKAFVEAIVYSGVGTLIFVVFFIAVVKFSPFPVIKEIEEDQNIALAILIGSVFLGISMIISAAITG